MNKFFWSPKQQQFIDFKSGSRESGAIALAVGAVRSGKTFSCVEAFLDYTLSEDEDLTHLVLGANLKTLRRNVFGVMQLRDVEEAKEKGWKRPGRLPFSQGDVTWRNRRYRFCAGTSLDTGDQFQGETVHSLFVDEATLLLEETWNEAMNRLSYNDSRVWGTANPAGTRHWLKRKWIDEGKIALHDTFGLDDNPWLTEPVKEGLRSRMSGQGATERRKIFGEWADSEGLVYGRIYEVDLRGFFGNTPETASGLPFRPKKVHWGLDYGNTDLCALVPILEFSRALAFNFPETPAGCMTRYIVLPPYQLNVDTFDNRDMLRLASQHIVNLAGRRRCRVHCDPSAHLALWKSHKRMRPRITNLSLRSGNNDRAVGITSLMSLLASGEMVIDRRAEELLDEVSGYEFDDDSVEDFATVGDDHYLDALRYGTLGALGFLSPVPPAGVIQ